VRRGERKERWGEGVRIGGKEKIEGGKGREGERSGK